MIKNNEKNIEHFTKYLMEYESSKYSHNFTSLEPMTQHQSYSYVDTPNLQSYTYFLEPISSNFEESIFNFSFRIQFIDH
jgi:hypothetical protein